MRTKDVDKVVLAVSQYADHIEGFYPHEWLEDDRNIALIDSSDNVALFEFVRPGVVMGHYFFWDRGKEAVSAAQSFLKEIFEYVEVVQGLTPLTNRPARWMNKRLGFKGYGPVKTHEHCELVMMTKTEWKELYG